MIVKSQVFIVFAISLSFFIENGEAGWKFWKKDEEATTTTTTPKSISDQSIVTSRDSSRLKTTTAPAISAGAAVINVANPGLVTGVGTTGETVRNNARPNRPNPGTEVGLDIAVPKPNRSGIGGTNGQSYRDWVLDLTGNGDTSRNQPPNSKLDPKSENHLATTHTSAIDYSSTSTSRNTPVQPTHPPAGSKSGNTPQQPLPQLADTASRPTSIQPIKPYATPGPVTASGTDQNRSSGSPNTGKSWANIAAGRPASSTMLPGQSGYSTQPTLSGEGRNPTAISGKPMQPSYPSSSSARDTLAGGVVATGASASTGIIADSTRKIYSSNPTYSRGNTITDEDLEKLSEALYIKETNNANQYITLNLQKQTTSSNSIDQAPQSLLAVNSEALQIPTIQRVLSIFDNYQLDTRTNEYISPAQRQEESLLVDTFLSTNVMSAAMRFLADKGFVRQDYYEYKDILRRIWFNLFSRGQGKIGSTGFEHVFMAETKQVDSGTEVLGLHNWIYFNAEETKGRLNYLGYIKKVDLGNKGSIIKMHAKFNDYDKPTTSIFIGTSPELEMALYTVCFYARPDSNCPVSLGGTKFNIITHKFKYRGKDLIGTAYPAI